MTYENISKDIYAEILSNDSLVNEEVLTLLRIMYMQPNHGGVCKDIARLLDKDVNAMIATTVGFAKRVLNEYDIEQRIRDNGKLVFWDIFFNGHDTENGYAWTLRKNLAEALKELITVSENAFLFTWNPKKLFVVIVRAAC